VVNDLTKDRLYSAISLTCLENGQGFPTTRYEMVVRTVDLLVIGGYSHRRGDIIACRYHAVIGGEASSKEGPW
jgi:hypothetical protein